MYAYIYAYPLLLPISIFIYNMVPIVSILGTGNLIKIEVLVSWHCLLQSATQSTMSS